VPVITGAGGAGRVIAGVALIALTIATGGFGGAAVGLFGAAAPIALGTVGLGIGTSLVLGGVAQLLSPVPTMNASSMADTEKDPRKSYSFSGIQNVSRAGVPVPVVYGETIVGSVVISAGVDTAQVVG
jgi:predicted phage tail protein